jgi:hypothetical protein
VLTSLHSVEQWKPKRNQSYMAVAQAKVNYHKQHYQHHDPSVA